MSILRNITNDKHREVENLPFIQCLLTGKLNEEQYVAYLYELKTIYFYIEKFANEHKLLEGLPDIERYLKIVADLEELAPHYHHDVLPSTKRYIKHIETLSKENSKLLFAHVYVRHMGDLYGGKLISRVVPGNGLCYTFDNRAELVKEFNARLSLELGEEANRAFDFFIDIFSELGDLLLTKEVENE